MKDLNSYQYDYDKLGNVPEKAFTDIKGDYDIAFLETRFRPAGKSKENK